MKHSSFAFLFILLLVINFGCSENNPIEPQVSNNEEANASLEKLAITSFTGTSKVVKPIDPGTTIPLPFGNTLIKGRVVEWFDQATDSRITGRSIWTVDQLIKPDGSVAYSGTTEIIVDSLGSKWEMWWYGSIIGGIGVANAYSTGVEGRVKGLLARSTYRIDLNVGAPPIAYYTVEGFIIEP